MNHTGGDKSLSSYLKGSVMLLESLCHGHIAEDLSFHMDQAIQSIVKALSQGLPLLVCGNGGSASDALHIAGELVGRFHINRKAFKVISLSSDPAILTCLANDFGYETVFERQVEAYGEKGGVLLGISTSGKSPNVLRAFKKAQLMEMTTIGLTGQGGQHNKMGGCDILLAVPSPSTPRIQEIHTCLYHYLCARVEEILAANFH
ncbi:MAG: SIS domain-containing protein [Proteobacteria bacterium]|nr:SIS domain-containing protein [Pseudomonadota bacterium]